MALRPKYTGKRIPQMFKSFESTLSELPFEPKYKVEAILYLENGVATDLCVLAKSLTRQKIPDKNLTLGLGIQSNKWLICWSKAFTIEINLLSVWHSHCSLL